MTDRRQEYFQMLNILAGCTDAMRGKTFPAELAWQVDAENLASKLFFHLGTVHKLQEGTMLPEIAGIIPQYVDFPSISTLTRAAFETFLCFHFIYIQPPTMAEKEFRHIVWKLGGLLDRQRFITTTTEGQAKIQEEKAICEKLKKKIGANQVFKQLPEPLRKHALKGKWRFDKHWVDIAENAGTHKDYFVSLYAYLSSFAHSGYLGILQFSQAIERHIQESLSNIYTSVNLTLMSHFILAYCSFFEDAQTFLDNHEEHKKFVQTYFITAEQWEELIRRA